MTRAGVRAADLSHGHNSAHGYHIFVIHVSIFFGKISLKILCPFLNSVAGLLTESCSWYVLDSDILKIFSPSLWLVFSFS